jgi:tetratricopeptide (TPR) repeat protein
MNLQTSDLEEAILCDIRNGAPVSLESALLVLSGLKTDAEIRSYQHKIDSIFTRFANKCDTSILARQPKPPLYWHRTIAQTLFEYLWNSKPKRFGEYFLLTDVVDAQLNPDVHSVVGNCVGLTSLYSVLGLRAGLNLTLLVASDHLLSRLRIGQQSIDIDHTDPQAFDCRECVDLHEFPLITLTANVINSRGLKNQARCQMAAAKADYEKAILINPEYANAFNNRGNIRFGDEELEGAIADYTEAIRLSPGFCEAYCNRGIAKHRLGRYDEAHRDYRLAMRINADYADARACLQVLDAVDHPKPPAGKDSSRSPDGFHPTAPLSSRASI